MMARHASCVMLSQMMLGEEAAVRCVYSCQGASIRRGYIYYSSGTGRSGEGQRRAAMMAHANAWQPAPQQNDGVARPARAAALPGKAA